jgi:20S proteasome subunit beta 7
MPVSVTQSPVSTGTSVLGLACSDGVLIAADHLASYGSMARFRNCQRVLQINNQTVAGCGGDYADFQFLSAVIEQKQIDEDCAADGFTLSPKSLFSWLTRVQYNRRCKFDPLWTTWIVGGLQNGKPFLGHVDKLGTAYQDKAIATGYGAYIATPMLRELSEKRDSYTIEEGKKIIAECLQVLYYRDARSLPKYHLAVVTKEGSRIEGPLEVPSNWDIAEYVAGYE